MRVRLRCGGLALTLSVLMAVAAGAQEPPPPGEARGASLHEVERWPPVATFSIVGFDPETGEVGGAVQSRVFSVGNGVLWAEANVGVVATQAIVDVSYGPQGLELLRQGLSAQEVVQTILENDPDPRPDRWTKLGRQFSVIDAEGNVATHTGPQASEWAGHRIGTHVSAQGNILAGPDVVNDMVEAFEATEGHLSFKLMAALEAGQAAGGDRRGMQSAAMIIVREDGGVWLNNDVVLRLQVDDAENPVAELRRLVEIAGRQRERIRGLLGPGLSPEPFRGRDLPGKARELTSSAVQLVGSLQVGCDVFRLASLDLVAFHEVRELAVLEERDRRGRRWVAGDVVPRSVRGLHVLTGKHRRQDFGLLLSLQRHVNCGAHHRCGATAHGIHRDEGSALLFAEDRVYLLWRPHLREPDTNEIVAHRGDHHLWIGHPCSPVLPPGGRPDSFIPGGQKVTPT